MEKNNQAQLDETKQDVISGEFDAMRLSLASPEQILIWSHGEVTKAETINYRTQKPEKDGLFDERIFGPTKDWECYCGKYKRIRYKDVVCDKCGVRVTRSIVRRERMGHIGLAVPVTHIWFLRGTPSTIGLILNLSVKDLERVVYFANYIILSVDEKKKQKAIEKLKKTYDTARAKLVKKSKDANESELNSLDTEYQTAKTDLEGLAKLQLLPESKYSELNEKYPGTFKAEIGAAALQELLISTDLIKLIKDLTKEANSSQGQKKKKILKRLKILEGMHKAKIHPEWTIINNLPVIPPDLRPMVQLPGGRFAASDLNDLYRRVINRNNRLKRLIELNAPEVICRNEKRMLQEAVDALIDNNARRERAISSTGGRRKLKSLSDFLKGKQGRFRQNLLGKRVDYSGRSVIVVGPKLRLNQCGIPKMMALELFKPLIMGRLIEQDLAHNVKSAGRMIERGRTEVWDTLEEIIADKYVLLNRAPTLHRLGIQAFKPILIEGKAIQLHPLVCTAFNADFDGDQMAVHVPLSIIAQKEAQEIMLSTRNLLKPADGSVVVNPSQDMVLGVYYLTNMDENQDNQIKAYSSFSEVMSAYDKGIIKLQSKIKTLLPEGIIVTTLGRILFNEILPQDYDFINETVNKKLLHQIIANIFILYGTEITAEVVDNIKDIGFKYAMESGISVGLDDYIIPEEKEKIITQAEEHVVDIAQQYEQGLITEEERYQRTIGTWKKVNEQITELIGRILEEKPTSTTVFVHSGARGDLAQVNQIAGMLGLVQDPSSRIIELPINSNYKEGFSELEYFNSTHGARKGLTDTALRTAESGYLTRRLIDVSQDVFITIDDCGDKEGIVLTRRESEAIGENFATRLAGRITINKIVNDRGGLIVAAKKLIDDKLAEKIANSKLKEVRVRSVLSCKSNWGICKLCYGANLARGEMVNLGEPVGIIAAQSIGEPGTQLTMKIFHKGGVAGEDITSGLPRVEEIFEARSPKGQAILADTDGTVSVREHENKHIIRITPVDLKALDYELKDRVVAVKSGDKIKPGDVIFTDKNNKKATRSKVEGLIELKKNKLKIFYSGEGIKEYTIPSHQTAEVANGDLVAKGQKLTTGSTNLQDMLRLLGPAAVRSYIVAEVQAIYALQGQRISDKHIEVIISQMLSRVQIEDSGDSLFVTGDIVDKIVVTEENKVLISKGKKPAIFKQLLLGITKVAASSNSFLSAASFQDTTRILINAAIRGKIDHLRGLKENVIIGRLIPVGTGFGINLTKIKPNA